MTSTDMVQPYQGIARYAVLLYAVLMGEQQPATNTPPDPATCAHRPTAKSYRSPMGRPVDPAAAADYPVSATCKRCTSPIITLSRAPADRESTWRLSTAAAVSC